MKMLLRLALAGLRHTPARAGLTALVVALGISVMVALQGFVLAIMDELAPLATGPEARADALVRPNGSIQQLPPDLPGVLAARPEVAWAAPRSEFQVTLLLPSEWRPSATLYAVDPAKEAGAGLLKLVEGELPDPERPGLAMEATVARNLGFRVGEPVGFYLQDGRRIEWPLVGLLGREGVGGAGGGIGLVVHQGRLSALGLPEGPSKVLVKLRSGEAQAWAVEKSLLLRPYGAYAEPARRPRVTLGGFLILTLLFSLLGPLLGSFLIVNTFAITLQERLRELALWRTIGATRRQLVAILLAEGVLIGLVGGAAGLATGSGLTWGIMLVLRQFVSVPPVLQWKFTGVSPLLAVVALLGGAVVTVLAALRPVLAISGRTVMSSQQAGYLSDPPFARWAAGLRVAAAAGALAIAARYANTHVALLASAVHFVLLLSLLPPLVLWLTLAVPAMFGVYGAAVSIGLRRMADTFRRSARAAALLMVAVGLLVGFGAVTGAAWQATAQALATTDPFGLTVYGDLTPGAQQALKSASGVADIVVLHEMQVAVPSGIRGKGADHVQAWAFDPGAGLPFALGAGEQEQVLQAMHSGGSVLISSRFAVQRNLRPGDQLALENPDGYPTQPVRRFTVAGIIPQDWDADPTLWLSLADVNGFFAPPIPAMAFVRLADESAAEQVAASLSSAGLRLQVQTRAERWALARRMHGEKLSTFLILLYLLCVFAVLGVLQTATLLVLEQRREMALLRAAGATARQTTLVVLVQAAFPGVLGTLLGAASGAVFGYHLVGVFSAWRGVSLSGGLTGWYQPVIVGLLLVTVTSLLMAASASRKPVAALLREG